MESKAKQRLNVRGWLLATCAVASLSFQPFPSYGDQSASTDKGGVQSAPLDLAVVDRLLTTTRTVRRRLDLTRPVEPERIEEAIEIAIQAPSGSNRQNWRFMVVTDPDKKKRIADLYRQSFENYAGPRPTGTPTTPGQRIAASAWHLADHMHEVPVLIIACIEGRANDPSPAAQAGLYGSILPSAWSLMLALRARGLGSAWTTLHLVEENKVATALGIPRIRHPSRPSAGCLLHGERLQTREATPGERGDLLEYLGGREVKPRKSLGVRLREAHRTPYLFSWLFLITEPRGFVAESRGQPKIHFLQGSE